MRLLPRSPGMGFCVTPCTPSLALGAFRGPCPQGAGCWWRTTGLLCPVVAHPAWRRLSLLLGSCQPGWVSGGAAKLQLQPQQQTPAEGPDAHAVPLTPRWASPGPGAGSSTPVLHHHPPQAINILVPGDLSWMGDTTSTCEKGSTARVTLYRCRASSGTGDSWASWHLPLLQAGVWGDLSSQAHSGW